MKGECTVSEVILEDQAIALGESFLTALASRDFDRLKACFHSQVSFRALVPRGVREGADAQEATGWLRRWFGDADEFQVLMSSAERVADRLHLAYRIRLHDDRGWQVIEQQAYCTASLGLIETMHLVCSGFRPHPESQRSGQRKEKPTMNGQDQTPQSRLRADTFYDAGGKGCTEGPLDEITRLMRHMASGQTLEVRATDPSVAGDLPAWCRLSGHEFIKQEGDRYLIRHK
jgi:TusA-related sulfurtransferase